MRENFNNIWNLEQVLNYDFSVSAFKNLVDTLEKNSKDENRTTLSDHILLSAAFRAMQ